MHVLVLRDLAILW